MYTELGTMIPKSGGEYVYLLDSMHPVFAYLSAWTSCIILKPSGLALISLTCAEYVLVPLFDDGCGTPPELPMKLLAISAIRESLVSSIKFLRVQPWCGYLSQP